jgi:ferredoxin
MSPYDDGWLLEPEAVHVTCDNEECVICRVRVDEAAERLRCNLGIRRTVNAIKKKKE